MSSTIVREELVIRATLPTGGEFESMSWALRDDLPRCVDDNHRIRKAFSNLVQRYAVSAAHPGGTVKNKPRAKVRS